MSESSTIFVGLDRHKESIAVAYVVEDRSLEPQSDASQRRNRKISSGDISTLDVGRPYKG